MIASTETTSKHTSSAAVAIYDVLETDSLKASLLFAEENKNKVPNQVEFYLTNEFHSAFMCHEHVCGA